MQSPYKEIIEAGWMPTTWLETAALLTVWQLLPPGSPENTAPESIRHLTAKLPRNGSTTARALVGSIPEQRVVVPLWAGVLALALADIHKQRLSGNGTFVRAGEADVEARRTWASALADPEWRDALVTVWTMAGASEKPRRITASVTSWVKKNMPKRYKRVVEDT